MVFRCETYRCVRRYAEGIEMRIRPGMPQEAEAKKCQKKFDKDGHSSVPGAQSVGELA